MPSIQNSKSTLAYISGLGSNDRGDNIPLNNTAKALVELGGFLIETATDNLEKGAHHATGGISSSMKLVNIKTQGNKFSLDVVLDSRYKFIDQGVKGTQGGTGKYQFRNNYVSKKMATALLQWVRKRGLSGKIKYTAKSVNEAKNKEIHARVKSTNDNKAMAYAISANIKKKGIRPTKFFKNAVASTQAEAKKKYAQALKLDIIESLNGLEL